MEKRRVTVDPLSLSLSCLKDVWISDPSTIKEEAIKLLTYIHLTSQIDHTAPFSKADYKEVGALVKKEIYGDYSHKFTTPFTEEQVEQFVTKYQMAYETPEEATVRAFDNKIHEIRKLVETTPIEIEKIVGKSGVTFISNFSILNSMMKDITKITQARDDMRAMVIKQTSRDSGKSNRKKSFLEQRRRDMQESRVASSSSSAPAESQEEDEGPDDL
jgi:hypothetical protein